MKKLTLYSVFFLLLGISISCRKDDKSSTNSIVQDGKWKITYFWDDKDETYHFTGYGFTFNKDGTVVAKKGSDTKNGTWSSFSSDDSNQKFILNFGNDAVFEDLNDDWHIIEKTESLLKLEDVSGGNGGVDYLTFEKI